MHFKSMVSLIPEMNEIPKTECGCPSGGGIKNGHIRYPSYGGTQIFLNPEIPTCDDVSCVVTG